MGSKRKERKEREREKVEEEKERERKRKINKKGHGDIDGVQNGVEGGREGEREGGRERGRERERNKEDKKGRQVMLTTYMCVECASCIPVKVTVPTRFSISGATPSLCRNRLSRK